MLISIAGLPMPQYGIATDYSLSPGDVLELHDELAEKWIASGHAEKAGRRKATDVTATESSEPLWHSSH